jgi:phosphoserine aminotransferase
VERLETFMPSWPVPKLFRLTHGGKLIEAIFEGETINTPSLMCVEDYIDALNWGKSLGGLDGLIARADANSGALSDWVERTPWVDFLATDPKVRSNTSVCLKIVDPAVAALPLAAEAAFAKSIESLLEKEKAAYDIGAYRDAPPGLRIWCGATIETSDIEALTPWLDYAFAQTKAALAKAA